MDKDFDSWNVVKKNTEQRSEVFGVHEREVWWVSFGINIGVEIDGKHKTYERPALVLRKFNNQMLWVLPMTSQTKTSKFHQKITFENIDYFVALTQLRTISTKRLLRKQGTILQSDFEKIIDKLATFFPRKKTPQGL